MDAHESFCHGLRNEDHALMPGMYAQVKFSVTPADPVWLIPATALMARAPGPQVLSVRDDRTVHYQDVQLGRDLGQSVEVLSGLTGREQLVVNPPDGLKEGARVAAEARGSAYAQQRQPSRNEKGPRT